MDTVLRASELHIRASRGIDNAELAPYLDAALQDDEALVRHVALIGAAHHCRDKLTPEAVRELLDTLMGGFREDWPSWCADYAAATDGNDLEQDILLALAELEPGYADAAIAPLIARFRRDRQFYEIGHAVVGLAFPRPGTEAANDALNEVQRSVLSALLDNAAIWSCDLDLPRVLFERGLPRTRNGIAVLMGEPKAYRGRRRTQWRVVPRVSAWVKSLFRHRIPRGRGW